MKALKYIGIGLLGLVLLVVVVGFLLPREVTVSRSVTVKARPSRVFAEVSNLKSFHNNWSPWRELDTNSVQTFEGPDAGKGAKMSWKGNKDMGQGSMIITAVTPDTRVDMDLDFMENGTGKSWYEITPTGEGSTVVWGMKTDLGNNPIGRIMGLMIDKWVGADYDKGLAKFKTFIESAPSNSTVEVSEIEVKPQHILSIRFKCKADEIGQKLGENFGLIMAQVKAQGLTEASPPGAFYYNYSPTDMNEIEAFVPVNKPGRTVGNVKASETKAGKAAMAIFFGDYEKMTIAHDAIHAWIDQHKHKIAGAPWEVYITDPMEEKDTAKWETRVYYPL
jgi:effector-binding domain-containing protein